MKTTLTPQQLKTWRLFLTTHATLIAQIDKALNEADQIPLNWYDVLIEVYEAPEHRLRMRDIAERVLLTRSGLTRLVDRLEQVGYLTREMDHEDRRGFYANITDKGIEAMRGAWLVYAEKIASYFADHLTKEEVTILASAFERMLKKEDIDT